MPRRTSDANAILPSLLVRTRRGRKTTTTKSLVFLVDDAVMFSAEKGIYGCFTRLTFTREAGCWYVSIIDSNERAMVAHIVDAMSLVAEWFGGNHVMPRGEYKP